MKKNAWKEVGKLYDPPKQNEPAEQKPDEPKKKEKAIRRKHGKNSKI